MELSDIATKLTTTVNAKLAIKSALKTAGATVSDTATFRDYANIIYNLKLSTSTVIASDSTIASSTDQYTKIENNLLYLYETIVWIKHALRCRGLDTTGKSISDYATMIGTITSSMPALGVTAVTLSGGTKPYTTKFSYTGTLGTNLLKYKISTDIPMAGADASSWETIDLTKDYTFYPKANSTDLFMLCVVRTDANGIVIDGALKDIIMKTPEAATGLTVTSTAGKSKAYNYTALTVTPALTKDDLYYYTTAIDVTNPIYIGQVLNISSKSSTYISWDGTSEIKLDAAVTKLQLIEVTSSYEVVNAGIFTPTRNIKPSSFVELTLSSIAGTNFDYTKISTSPILLTGDKYYYKTNATYDADASVDNFDATGYTAWNGTDEIPAESGISILIVDVSGTTIKQSGSIVAVSKNHTVDSLLITSVAGSTMNTTALTVSPKLVTGDLYYYKIDPTGVNIPDYKDIIDSGYESWNGSTDIYISNGTRILLIETDSSRAVIKAGYVTVVSSAAYTLDLIITSTASTTTTYGTKLSIIPALESGHKYKYLIGFTKIDYDQDASSNIWKDWNGISEILAPNDEILTLIETSSDYKIKKYGIVKISSKPETLEILSFSAIKGATAGYTYIVNGNSLSAGNHYVYKLNTEIAKISLNDDATTWNSWVGQEIKATSDDTVVIAEVNASNLVKKVGSVKAVPKDADPILGTLAVTTSANGTSGYTKITVTPALTSGYTYRYSFTNSLPAYHGDLTNWFTWDGSSTVKALNGSSICIAEATVDLKAEKAGLATVISLS